MVRHGRPALAATFALLLAFALPPAASQAAACARPADWTGGTRTAGEVWTAWWRPEPAPIKVSTHFSIRFHLCGPPVSQVRVRGWMPDHRHGMNYRPVATLDGRSGTVDGLLFHMPGLWQLILGIRGETGRETLIAETVLE